MTKRAVYVPHPTNPYRSTRLLSSTELVVLQTKEQEKKCEKRIYTGGEEMTVASS